MADGPGSEDGHVEFGFFFWGECLLFLGDWCSFFLILRFKLVLFRRCCVVLCCSLAVMVLCVLVQSAQRVDNNISNHLQPIDYSESGIE